jgi:hypothetical protein
MTNSNIIIITVTLSVVSTLGVFAAIRVINQYTRPPVNSLVRSGDIELVDYIEPSQPVHVYHPFSINNFQFQNYDRILSYPPSYETGVIPSYRSGTIPVYQSMEGININSCLENENIFNSFFTFLILIIMFLVIIF